MENSDENLKLVMQLKRDIDKETDEKLKKLTFQKFSE